MELFTSHKKRTATVTLLLLICAVACSSVLAEETKDQRVFLSWSKFAVVDTLVVSGAGEHDCFLLFQESSTPDSFYSFRSRMFISDGVEVLSVEGIYGNGGTVSLTGGVGGAEVWVNYDSECVPVEGLVPVAVFQVSINPSDFWSTSGGFIVPYYNEEDPSGSTRVVVGALDCSFGIDFPHEVRPVFVLDASVPVYSFSFDGLKALFR